MTNQDVQNSAVEMTFVISATYSGRLAKRQSHLSVLNYCWKPIRISSRKFKSQPKLLYDYGITGFNKLNHRIAIDLPLLL